MEYFHLKTPHPPLHTRKIGLINYIHNLVVSALPFEDFFIVFCDFQGASHTILKATLVDLQEIYETTTQRISAVLTWRWENLTRYTNTHWHTQAQAHTPKFGFLFAFIRYIALLIGCLLAGKVYQKMNQYLYFGLSLSLMGTCVFVAPFFGSFWSFLMVMSLHGFFTAFISVGKPWCEQKYNCLLG